MCVFSHHAHSLCSLTHHEQLVRLKHTQSSYIQQVYICMCDCMCNCMFVCVCMCSYVCLYVRLLLLDALHLGGQTFRGSSMTPGQVVCFIFFKFTLLLLFLRTIELPIQVITYNCPQRYANNYVQLSTSCVFSSIVPTYVLQGQGVIRHYYNGQYYVAILRDDDWQDQVPRHKWIFL